MEKWNVSILTLLLMIGLAQAVCCERTKDCIVTETCQDGACGDCSITVYNPAGSVNLSQNFTMVTYFTYQTNLSGGFSSYETYPYTINCSTNKTCEGDCGIEVHDYCGRTGDMSTGISLFLLVLNAGIFLIPVFLRKLSDNIVTNYVVRKMIFLAGFTFLWFNSLIFRLLASQFNLGIDEQLKTIWWVFTIGMFAVIMLTVYYTGVGAVRLAKEARIAKRMGYNE